MQEQPKVKLSKERPEHYVNGREFFEAMKEYHGQYLESIEHGTEKPQVSNVIARAITQINNRLSNLYNFNGYTYKSEMISDGILKCLEKVHRFDPSVSENPFAFFTQISWQCFISRIKIEQHQSSVKAKMIREKMSDEFVEHGVDSDNEDSGNAFVEFLKDVDCFTDYTAQRIEKIKKEIHPSLVHRNKTAYKKKDVLEKEPKHDTDLSEFLE
jgi:hypothetical protein